MNTFNQSDVIRIVESILPAVRESNNPAQALIKRAQELNLPPAVLEKAGHVYNTAKTLNHLETAGALEQRSVPFQTLDVDEMLNQYESYQPAPVSTGSSLWHAALAKSASATEYEIPEEFNPFAVLLKAAAAKDEEDDSDKEDDKDDDKEDDKDDDKDEEDKKPTMKELEEADILDRDAQTTKDIQNQHRRILTITITKAASAYTGLYCSAQDMDKLEADCSRMYPAEQVKKAFDLIEQTVLQQSTNLHVKRATDSTKTNKLIKTSSLHTLVGEAVEQIQFIDAAEELYQDLVKQAVDRRGFQGFKKKDPAAPSDETTEEQPSGTDSNVATAELPDLPEDLLAQYKEVENSSYDEDYKRVFLENLLAQATERKQQQSDPQAPNSEDDEEDAEDTTTSGASSTSLTGATITPLGSSLPASTSSHTADALKGFGTGASAELDRLLKAISSGSTIQGGKNLTALMAGGVNRDTNARQAEIDLTAQLARGEAALNTLLLTDPVVSQYDEEEMREIFFSLFRANPEAVADINQLRGLLRTAGNFDGVADIQVLNTLRDMRDPQKRNGNK